MPKPPKQYTGSVYIGVVGGETEIGECRDSIEMLARRPGDSRPEFSRGTKGYEARQLHLRRWYEDAQHPFLLLLDHDMLFPDDTLERLRAHARPYVSGYYMRRRYQPIAPVWFKPWSGHWPFEPWSADPERGRLHPLGASGWGCLLIHRDVVTAVRAVLKGEWEVIEDDMDVWPYDLAAVLAAIRGLRSLTTEKIGWSTLRPALEAHVAVLEREIRPLRGAHSVVGSDIRFPFYALAAGFQLWGDPDVRPAHVLNYPLSPDDYTAAGAEEHAHVADEVRRGLKVERQKVAAGLAVLQEPAQ